MDNPYIYTLAKKGAKIINIHTNGKEKNRISCILTIAANGNKLSPFIVFKGEKNKKLKSELMNLPDIKNKKIYATTQINAWVDEDIFKEYIINIIIPYKKDNKKILFIIIMLHLIILKKLLIT